MFSKRKDVQLISILIRLVGWCSGQRGRIISLIIEVHKSMVDNRTC